MTNQAEGVCAGPKAGSRSHVPLPCQAQLLRPHNCRLPETDGQGAFLVTEKRVIRHAFSLNFQHSCQHPETNGHNVCFTKVNDQAGAFYNAESLAIWAGLMWARLIFGEC